MDLRKRLSDWHSQRFGGWTIDDPRPTAANARYTYYLPSDLLLAAIAPGDSVKAVFRPSPANRRYDAERMWVTVKAVGPAAVSGVLDSTPLDMPQLQPGTPVTVPRTHVIDIDWAEGHEAPQEPPRRWYWERCMVDDCVANGRSHADYLYREEPDLTREGDEEPDSGWRIRGTQEAIDEDAANGRKPIYIALGKVLNEDDRWLDLTDEPIGEAFQWWVEEQRYVRLDRE